jgi:hypothetical protein
MGGTLSQQNAVIHIDEHHRHNEHQPQAALRTTNVKAP